MPKHRLSNSDIKKYLQNHGGYIGKLYLDMSKSSAYKHEQLNALITFLKIIFIDKDKNHSQIIDINKIMIAYAKKIVRDEYEKNANLATANANIEKKISQKVSLLISTYDSDQNTRGYIGHQRNELKALMKTNALFEKNIYFYREGCVAKHT